MKKWHLFINNVFEGYAPNRAKARSWVCGGTNRLMLLDDRARISTRRNGQMYEAIYKEVIQ